MITMAAVGGIRTLICVEFVVFLVVMEDGTLVELRVIKTNLVPSMTITAQDHDGRIQGERLTEGKPWVDGRA